MDTHRAGPSSRIDGDALADSWVRAQHGGWMRVRSDDRSTAMVAAAAEEERLQGLIYKSLMEEEEEKEAAAMKVREIRHATEAQAQWLMVAMQMAAEEEEEEEEAEHAVAEAEAMLEANLSIPARRRVVRAVAVALLARLRSRLGRSAPSEAESLAAAGATTRTVKGVEDECTDLEAVEETLVKWLMQKKRPLIATSPRETGMPAIVVPITRATPRWFEGEGATAKRNELQQDGAEAMPDLASSEKCGVKAASPAYQYRPVNSAALARAHDHRWLARRLRVSRRFASVSLHE